MLIIGGGNSGVELARELTASHTVTLAVQTPRRPRPVASYTSAAGESVSWLSRTRRTEPVFGDSYEKLRHAETTIRPAVIAVNGSVVTFADGTQAEPGSVSVATGYLSGDGCLPEDAHGDRPRTMTGLLGLFVAGTLSRPWFDGQARPNDELATRYREWLAAARRRSIRPAPFLAVV
ncbi:MAG: hypothetical protein ACK5O2_08980 [Microthrixaceae bacterium]